MDTKTLSLLSGGPMVKRTHCYCQGPSTYDITCPKNPTHETTWSEFEGRIWCFKCKKDYIPWNIGIFDGPIPMEVSHAMGVRFDRVNLKTKKTIADEARCMEIYRATWVKSKKLDMYKRCVEELRRVSDE